MNRLYTFLLSFSFLLLLTHCDKLIIDDSSTPPKNKRNTSDISQLLNSSNNTGFDSALEPRQFIFPQDHGPHRAFKTEWWYVTGNLSTPKKQHFGFQITFFRRAIQPKPPESQSSIPSHWATNQIYMAHFAISDIDNKTFYSFERFSRSSLAMAGAKSDPFKVWLLNWSLQSKTENFFPLTLNAGKENIEISVEMNALKPMVLHGDKGLSKKNISEGNASFYYSFTRLASSGVIKIDNEIFPVTGYAWFDREWSTSALEKNQQGWDWFSLQLSNGDDIMFYQLRKKMGKIDTISQGTYISKNGDASTFNLDQVHIQPLTFWLSDTNVEYPASWKFEIPSKNVILTVTPAINNQEINHSVRYWEGTVKIEGTIKSKKITGRGYVELSGYMKK